MTLITNDAVDGRLLRETMRRVPAAVTVVTVGGSEPRGITIGSFTSVSLDPPLIVFNVDRSARMHDLLDTAGAYVVHVLRSHQSDLSNHFADPDLDGAGQFGSVPHTVPSDGEPPVLEGTLCVMHCQPYARYDAGDHSLFVGRVVSVQHDPEGSPILYFDRAYHEVGEAVPE